MNLAWAIPAAWLPLLVLIAVAAALWVRRHYLSTEPPAPRGVRRLLAGLRTSAVVLLLAAIAGPRLQRSGDVALPPEAVIVVEDSASMGLRDAPGDPARWDGALAWAAQVESLLARRDPPVRATVLRGNGLAATRALRDAPGEPPSAVGTDLGRLAAETTRAWSSRNLRALVLVTDGQETQAAAQGPVAPTDGALPLLIGVGDPSGPADLELADVRYPETAFVGDQVVVEAVVAVRGPPRRDDLRLRLALVQDADTLAAVTAVVGPGDPTLRVELAFTPRAAGLQVARLLVAPLVNERYLANNEVSLAVAVRQDREKLLLISGRPDWNVRVFAQAAAQERRLTLDVVHPGERGLRLDGAPWTPPRGAAGWLDWDGVILLGDAAGQGDLDVEGLAAAVGDGLGLLVVDSPRTDLPAALAGLLPVVRGGAVGGSGSLQVRREEAGHSLLSGLSADAAAWAWLPPLGPSAPARARPEAKVLLTSPGRDGAGPSPLLAIGAAGKGAVAWLGTDELWTLAFWQPPASAAGVTEHPVRRLARNLLVWTAAGDELGGVTIAGHRTLYREGEAIRLETQVRGLRGEGMSGAIALELRDTTPAGAPRSFTPTPVPGELGRGRVTLPPQAPGRYRVRPVAAGTDSALGPEREFVVVSALPEEAQVRQDRRRLRALAAAWGGYYVDGHAPGAARSLAGVLDAADWSAATGERRSEVRLVHGWWLIAVATLLLGAEWAVRRARGML
ncbi:MAG: hypothetical protein C0395_09225 [Gemmatimonas sp.]|nr:hypothetical protein [Gemmatimonas sp.]